MSELKDTYWTEISEILNNRITASDRLLAPLASWPPLPGTMDHYTPESHVSDIAPYQYVALHKAYIPSFPQRAVAELMNNWHVVHANAVFVLFCAHGTHESGIDKGHIAPLLHYLAPKVYWRPQGQPLAFLHIPKTCGTAVWQLLSADIRSKVYFQSDATLAAFDGDINDFELIGGHFHASTLIAKGWSGPVLVVLRDPVERTLSAIGHARREGEDVRALPSTLVGLDQPLDRNAGELFFFQLNLQTMLLGAAADEKVMNARALVGCLSRALQRVADPRWIFAAQDDPTRIGALLQQWAGTRTAELPRANVTPHKLQLVSELEQRRLLEFSRTACIADFALCSIAGAVSAEKAET
jgi:hypothetical protein